MPAYQLKPLDTLFFRDARLMNEGSYGANWPLPTVAHEALRSALLRSSGNLPLSKNIAHRKVSSEGKVREKKVASDAFRSLRTIGPFPLRTAEDRQETLYFPCPADVVPDSQNQQGNPKLVKTAFLAPLNTSAIPPGAETNFPAPWLLPVSTKTTPSKETMPQWVTIEWFKNYLAATAQSGLSLENHDKKLYSQENRVGIEIDPESHTAQTGQIYFTEQLRLHDKTRLWMHASLNDADFKHPGGMVALNNLLQNTLTLGGESRVCYFDAAPDFDFKELIPAPKIDNWNENNLIKWVLVTPAVFNYGWRPNWVRETDGRVLLKEGEIQRQPQEDRRSWRARIREFPDIEARLLAVRLPKPLFFSGWDLLSESQGSPGAPKRTCMAAASGSVYYFQPRSAEAAVSLLQALHGRTMSDCFGEKGLGLGFCGVSSFLN